MLENLQHGTNVDKFTERAIEAHLEKAVCAIQVVADMQITPDIPKRPINFQFPDELRKTTQVISTVPIHTGDHDYVRERRYLEKIFEPVLSAQVVDVIITHRQGVAQNSQADGVRIASDSTKSDSVFAGSALHGRDG
jgi:hypothetical protein